MGGDDGVKSRNAFRVIGKDVLKKCAVGGARACGFAFAASSRGLRECRRASSLAYVKFAPKKVKVWVKQNGKRVKLAAIFCVVLVLLLLLFSMVGFFRSPATNVEKRVDDLHLDADSIPEHLQQHILKIKEEHAVSNSLKDEDGEEDEDETLPQTDDYEASKEVREEVHNVIKASRTPRRATPAPLNEDTLARQRAGRKFYIIAADEHSARRSRSSKRKRSAAAAHAYSPDDFLAQTLLELGYAKAESVTDSAVRWILAHRYDCDDPGIATALNMRKGDSSNVLVVCNGDANMVRHLSMKEVVKDRIEWFDMKMQRWAKCLRSDHYFPSSFVLHPTSDAKILHKLITSKGFTHDSGFVVKASDGAFKPVVTHHLASDVKKLLLHRGFTGAVLQRYIENPLLWGHRKFSLRTYAYVLQSSPIIILYHDGTVFKSLEKYLDHKNRRSHFANVTNAQSKHPDYDSRRLEAFACLSDFQKFLTKTVQNPEIKHYVKLVLKPRLKRIMSTAIFALRKDHASHKSMRTTLRLCFDFVIDANWNVWLVDVSNGCDLQLGGPEYKSSCKTAALEGLGSYAVKLMEEIDRRKAAGKSIRTASLPLGTFEPLIDESNPNFDMRQHICHDSPYERFRRRQTFGKCAVQKLFRKDGYPQSTHDVSAESDSEEWKCPICGYKNAGRSHHCELCGSEHPNGVPKQQQPASSSFTNFRESDRRHRAGILVFSSRRSDDALPGSDNIDFTALDEELDLSTSSNAVEREVDRALSPVSKGRMTTCLGRKFEMLKHTSIVGEDIEPLRTSSDTTCCVACAHNPRCNAFTYTASDFKCWLKLSGEHRGMHSGSVSGIRVAASAMAGDGSGDVTGSIPHSAAVKREYYKKKLMALYRQHDPMKINHVDFLLDRYKDNEERLLQRTKKQYSNDPPGANVHMSVEDSDEHGMHAHDYRSRLETLFRLHSPDKLDSVNSLLEQFRGREMLLLDHLSKKFEANDH